MLFFFKYAIIYTTNMHVLSAKTNLISLHAKNKHRWEVKIFWRFN